MSVQAMTDGRRAWEQTGGRRAWYQTALRRWGCQHAHQMLPRPRAVVPELRCLRVHLRLLDKRQRLWIQAWVIQLRLRLWLWRQGQRLKTPLRLTRRQGHIDDRNATTGGAARPPTPTAAASPASPAPPSHSNTRRDELAEIHRSASEQRTPEGATGDAADREALANPF